jgi:plasmid maintenance system antidote protein VapI
MLPLDQVYFDVNALFDDLKVYLGVQHLTLLGTARALGVERQAIRRLIQNESASISVETYMRWLALLGRPVGSWLRVCQQGDSDG